MRETFDILREWNEEIIKNEDEATEYCFIRLYQTEYKKPLSFGNIVKTVNLALIKPGKNDKKYTHAAINFQLNDNFVGVNFETEGNAIKIEHLRTLGREKDTAQDRDKSKFDVFCLKLTKSEYEYLKKNLSNLKKENKLKYSFFRLLVISTKSLFSKIKKKLFDLSNEEKIEEVKGEDLTQVEKSLICSTFVAFVLSQTSKTYRDYFDMTDKFLKTITPNDLTWIPGIEFMFGGKWSEYSTKVRNYTNERTEFKKYVN